MGELGPGQTPGSLEQLPSIRKGSLKTMPWGARGPNFSHHNSWDGFFIQQLFG